MSSRSPGVRVLGPCSRTSASSRMGLAVSGRKANPAVMPGRFSGSAMCGMGAPLLLTVMFWVSVAGTAGPSLRCASFRMTTLFVTKCSSRLLYRRRFRQILLADGYVAFAGDELAAFAIHRFVFGLPGGESVDVAVEHAERGGDQDGVVDFEIGCS